MLVAVACASERTEEEVREPAASVQIAAEPIQPLDPLPVDDRLVELGGRLFHDVRLSGDNTLSCASCHAIPSGGDDGRPTSVGIGGAVGPINAPTVLNSALNVAQFWDGRAADLQEQAAGPVLNPAEMGGSWPVVVARLQQDRQLRAAFDALFEDGVTSSNITRALAEYETSLITVDAPFDRWLRGERGVLPEEAVRGYGRFKELGCVSCHQGRGVGGNLFQRFGVMGDYFADRGDPTDADLGRFAVTHEERDRHRFKVPMLRNVALTAPYFHDGSAATLEEAVQTMGFYQLGRRLEPDEVDDLVAFLESLTGEIPDTTRYR